jgi:Carbon-nitrogen hydrolase
MDATPAPLQERLARAEKIIAEATRAGAQLVVLPELFNIGYAYMEENFQRAESIDGTTATWMKDISAHFGIHLAGTFLLFEQGEIYNSMLLFSPSGEKWRYDKNFPWAWERGYFRERSGITIANTELGDLGLMICWDLGHLKLWKRYAGKVDMIVLASCPPDAPNGSFQLPNGENLAFDDLGSAMNSTKFAGIQFFGEMVNQQARWLGTPVVNSGANGRVQTPIPKSNLLLKMLSMFAPRMNKMLPKSDSLRLSCGMIPSCKIVDGSGHILTERAQHQGEGFVLAEVTLADSKSMPTQAQPKIPLDRFTSQMAILNADVFIPWMMKSVYRYGIKTLKK